MKEIFLFLVLASTLISTAAAENARFFRISGPANSRMLAVKLDGTVVWTNSQPGATFTFQTATTLDGITNWVDYAQVAGPAGVISNKLFDLNPPAGMALIPAGSFTMGNSMGDGDITDASPKNVTVSEFYMDVNLVGWSQWQTVYNYATNHGYKFFENTIYGAYTAGGKAGNHPVQNVDWFDCVKWSNARSQQAGLAPVYYTDAGLTQVYTNGEPATVYQNMTNNGYRLPTEAEWEKAARGGLAGKRFPWGNSISQNQANYVGATGSFTYDLGPNGYNAVGAVGGTSPATSPVGSFAPNGYGLYDMAGNVAQWCWDWYGTPYGQPTTNNPTGAGSASGTRVARGGCWLFNADAARCASRDAYSIPKAAYSFFGFRCVRRP